MQEHKVPFGLATSTSSQRIYTKMKGKEFIVEAMQFTVFGDEVKHGKPDPEIYLEAARRAGGVDPGRCLVIEDSPCGVKYVFISLYCRAWFDVWRAWTWLVSAR